MFSIVSKHRLFTLTSDLFSILLIISDVRHMLQNCMDITDEEFCLKTVFNDEYFWAK